MTYVYHIDTEKVSLTLRPACIRQRRPPQRHLFRAAHTRETAKIILAYRGQPELEIVEVREGIGGGSRNQRVDVNTDDVGEAVRFLVRAANLTACDLSKSGIHLTNMEQTAQRIAETLR